MSARRELQWIFQVDTKTEWADTEEVLLQHRGWLWESSRRPCSLPQRTRGISRSPEAKKWSRRWTVGRTDPRESGRWIEHQRVRMSSQHRRHQACGRGEYGIDLGLREIETLFGRCILETVIELRKVWGLIYIFYWRCQMMRLDFDRKCNPCW